MTESSDHSATSKPPLRVLLCGACLAGNMGGPALYLSMAEALREQTAGLAITLLSKYPAEDEEPCAALGWRLVAYPTTRQLAVGVPLALAYSLLRKLHLPCRWLARGAFKAYLDHDLLVDLSGISFTDDRPLSGLVINSLWLVPAVATNLPYVKAAQAMGPFKRPLVRLLAKFFLSHALAVVARGPRSAELTRELLPGRTVHELPDVAFVLQPASDEETDRALATAGVPRGEPYSSLGPSYLVDSMVAGRQGPGVYARMMARAADKLVEWSGHSVVLVPHARAVSTTPKLDDLTACLAIRALCRHSDRVHVIRESLSAPVLKAIIARSEVAVGSRFHFMVAAMSSGVPALAVSWGHKYHEMMSVLGQGGLALSHENLTEVELLGKLKGLWESREAVRQEMTARLPHVRRQAAENATVAVQALMNHRSAGRTASCR